MPEFTERDRSHMARALELAARGLASTDPNPRVGCVIVSGDRVLGEGWHERAGGPHAEIAALRAAGGDVRGATLYVSLEPCNHHGRTPPCVDTLLGTGLGRIVCAVPDPNPHVTGGGLARLRAAGIRVETGLMSDEAVDLNCGFVQRMKHGRPFIRLKLAASLDGRTALSTGESRWITGEASREDVQHWRARSSVVLTGLRTVLHDDPRLDVRIGTHPRQPLRVVLDPRLELPETARILGPPGEVLVFSASTDPGRRSALEARGARIEEIGRAGPGLDLAAVMSRLASLQANEVWVECGARLAGALLGARLVDEIVVYLAPHVLGSSARAMFGLAEPHALSARRQLEFRDVRRIGEDVRLVARPIA